MTTLSLTTADATTAKVDAVIIGVHPGPDGVQCPWDAVAEVANAVGATGKLGEVQAIPGTSITAAPRIIVVGLGELDALTLDRVRLAAAAASQAATGLKTVVSTLSSIDLTAAAEGHLLGAYTFDTYKAAERSPVGAIRLSVTSASKTAKTLLHAAVATAEAVCLARDLVNTAPNHLSPAVFADRAVAAATAAGLAVEVLDEKALAKQGFGGILAVGAGSARPPRLVRISYTPAKPAAKVALVGKGITFDTGGISLKPGLHMAEMTSDMAGAAAVLAATVGAAALKLPVAVTATIPMAENMPSGTAQRPGDVITHYAPKGTTALTSLVLNTDAEGRLVLADGIARACADKPDYLLDTATLTGAIVIALGQRTMGVFGTDDLRQRVVDAADACGETAWPMPLLDELRDAVDSQLADIRNVTEQRFGGAIVGAQYLARFVTDDVQWAHLDVAGPAFNAGARHGYTPTGGTGVPVRTLLTLLADIADLG